MININEMIKTGHLCKLFDGTPVPEEKVETLLELVRSAPSSINLQPGYYVVASTPGSRACIAKSMMGGYEANLPKIQTAHQR